LETTHYSKVVVLSPEDNRHLLNLCGRCDEHIKLIENRLEVHIKQRGYTFSISGSANAVHKACDTLTELYHEAQNTKDLGSHHIHMYLQSLPKIEDYTTPTIAPPRIDIRVKTGLVTARGENQVRYINNMMNNDVNFGVGPAGTGKTYLAVACAVNALETERVSRIILTRPIVEAGEKLGFLPGDLAQKVHPYLHPLYDALYEMLGTETVTQLIEKNIIELAPLAYMRGRSLNDAYIILDEGQNTTIEQMKMFLTRIGFNSKAIITGDASQIDLPNRRDSGLSHAAEVLKNVKGISFTQFESKDVVRHPLVQLIVEAYESHNKDKENNK
jgi:phosphate starvation-inducible PhoH-like protein